MAKPNDLDLEADEIVDAAIVILRERGLDAVSMRNVADRLGVSTMPLYSRVGNKEALIDAVADQLLADLAPAAATISAAPASISPNTAAGNVSGKPTTESAASGLPPIA